MNASIINRFIILMFSSSLLLGSHLLASDYMNSDEVLEKGNIQQQSITIENNSIITGLNGCVILQTSVTLPDGSIKEGVAREVCKTGVVDFPVVKVPAVEGGLYRVTFSVVLPANVNLTTGEEDVVIRPPRSASNPCKTVLPIFNFVGTTLFGPSTPSFDVFFRWTDAGGIEITIG